MAICIPAFSPDAVHGDGLVPGKDSSEASGGRTAGCCWQFVTYSATSGAEVRRITRLRPRQRGSLAPLVTRARK